MSQPRDDQGRFKAATKARRGRPFAFLTDRGSVVSDGVLAEYATKSKQVDPDIFGSAYGGEVGLVEPIYTPTSLQNLLEINTYHTRCCEAKARDSAGSGWLLSSQVDDPAAGGRDVLNAFFRDVASELWYRYQYDLETIGYGAIEMTRVDADPEGPPEALHHIKAHTIRPHKDKIRFQQRIGTNSVWFKKVGYEADVHYENGTIYPQGTLAPEDRATEVIWGVNYTPESDYYGLPDITPAIGTVAADFNRREYNRKFFENHGIPTYAITISGNFDPGEIDEYGRDEVQKMIEEKLRKMPDNPHSSLILSLPSVEGEESDIEVNFEPLATDIRDASFRLFRQDNRDETIVAHGVPPYRIGVMVSGQLAGNMAEEATEIYKRSVIEPRQTAIEDVVNRRIVREGFGVEDWRWEFTDIDTRDEDHELDILERIFAVGGVTPAEIRDQFADRFGLDPAEHPAMQMHYVDGKPIDAESADALDIVERSLKSLRREVADAQ